VWAGANSSLLCKFSAIFSILLPIFNANLYYFTNLSKFFKFFVAIVWWFETKSQTLHQERKRVPKYLFSLNVVYFDSFSIQDFGFMQPRSPNVVRP